MPQPFRILSLSGGGVRGVFQATFLRELQRELGPDLRRAFDLIAGTSTGAIVALSVALDVPLEKVVEFYKQRAPVIFRPRALSAMRRGPKYNNELLRQALVEVFATKTLEDADKPVIITATTVDRFEHRVFSNIKQLSATDGGLSAVDVALASTAAPTYFAPVRPTERERAYVDGGVWANSPCLLAILVAHRYLNVPLEDIRVLSVGTGHFPNGRRPQEIHRLRPLSLNSVQTVLELIWDSQESFADEYSRVLLGPGHFTKVDVPLNEDLELDKVQPALSILPALAEKEAAAKAQHIRDLFLNPPEFHQERRGGKNRPTASHDLVHHLLPAAGLTAFYPSRDYYRRFRDAGSVDAYVGTASRSIFMISINLMTGVPFDGLCEMLRTKLESNDKFEVLISLIDPKQRHLMVSLAPALDMTAGALANSIKDSLTRLATAKGELEPSFQKRFSIRVHRSIPFGSAILLDHREVFGRIQIETKIYKAPFRKSFAFEVVPTDDEGLYATLAKGYEDLLRDGTEVTQDALADIKLQ